MPFILCLIIIQDSFSLLNLRNNYSDIVNDEKQCMAYLKFLKETRNPSPTTTAFIAALTASTAQFQINPYSKIKTVSQAGDVFEKVIQEDSKNPEFRYLRLTVEQYTPSILGMSHHIKEDKQVLISHFNNYVAIAGRTSAKNVIAFLKYHKLCSNAELNQLEQWIH